MKDVGERYYEQPNWLPTMVRFADENPDWLERIAVTDDACAFCGTLVGWLTKNGSRYATRDYWMADEDAELVACLTCWEESSGETT